jgi:hypothetical protein
MTAHRLDASIGRLAHRLRDGGGDTIPLHFGVLTAGASGTPPRIEVDGKLMRYLVSYTTHNIGDVVAYVKTPGGECVVLGELQG